MSHKTKAALPGRQCQSTKLKPTQHSMLADLVNNQPFGSMPRCCSSLRSMRLIQVARNESPSLRISSSSWERSSCARRIWYWSVFTFSLDIVITKLLVLPCGCNYNVTYLDLQPLNMAKPRSATTRSGLLTTNANETSEAAMNNHITPLNGRNSLTLNKFTWRFLALNRHDKKAKPCRLSVEATTEHEARRILAPHFILSFAARLPAIIENTSTVQEVRHV